jgi:hypothetical protein
MCLNRQPFIEAHTSLVPIPLNCNDIDLDETNVTPRPLTEPTEMSMNIFKAQAVKAMNKLYVNNGRDLSSFEFIIGIDLELSAVLDNLPWYMQINQSASRPELSGAYDYVGWQHHLMHTFVFVQRIRMYRPFLQGIHSKKASSICVESAESALAVYRSIRSHKSAAFLKSHRFIAQNYQIFSTAITLAVFLLVERPQYPDMIRADIEMVISDLASLEDRGTVVPLAIDGVKLLRKVLEMYDLRETAVNAEPTSLVPVIYAVIGGKSTTQKYLERCKIGYIVNSDSVPQQAMDQNRGHGCESQMPITPTSSLDSSLFCGDMLSNYPAVEYDYETGMGFEMPPDHSFWEQWDF